MVVLSLVSNSVRERRSINRIVCVVRFMAGRSRASMPSATLVHLTRRMNDRHANFQSAVHSDGTTHVLFGPLDFIARLAALVPRPRVNLTRYNGVFAPNSRYRARVTPAKQDEAEVPLGVASGYRLLSGLHFRFRPRKAIHSPRIS